MLRSHVNGLLAGVRGIAKLQCGVVKLECGQKLFVVFYVRHLSFDIVPPFDDMCRNSFGPGAVSERYLHIRIRSSPHDLVVPLGQFGGSYRYTAVEYYVGRVLGGGVCSEWKESEDEGKGQGSFRHVYLLDLLPIFDRFKKQSPN
jgi:hypothetical protein